MNLSNKTAYVLRAHYEMGDDDYDYDYDYVVVIVAATAAVCIRTPLVGYNLGYCSIHLFFESS